MGDRMTESKQFAVVVDSPEHNGYPPSVSYVDAQNLRMIGSTSVINPPPGHYTYAMLEMREAMQMLPKAYPYGHIEAHEVAYFDHRAMIDRWSKLRRRGRGARWLRAGQGHVWAGALTS